MSGAVAGERWHYGRWLALTTVLVAVCVSLLPITPDGQISNCGNAIHAALLKPGRPDGVAPTYEEICHPLGVSRLWVAGWILVGGLAVSAVVGRFAQPPRGPQPS